VLKRAAAFKHRNFLRVTNSVSSYLNTSADILKTAAEGNLDEPMDQSIQMVSSSLKAGKTLLVCGNGGSASDAMHIAGELVARFLIERPGLRVIALGTNPAQLTAWSNDYDYDSALAREVEAYGEEGGVLLGISTSGNSKNVVAAFEKAKSKGLSTIALTGAGGGELGELADILLAAPSSSTPRIQEAHICLYHYFCEKVEEALAAD